VDGQETFAALYEAMLAAKHTIFITDWWLSPEIYLIRDGLALHPQHRLDNVLKQKAEQGVRVYILLWNETKIALSLCSGKVKKKLEVILQWLTP
jgi:phospholipase D1/2